LDRLFPGIMGTQYTHNQCLSTTMHARCQFANSIKNCARTLKVRHLAIHTKGRAEFWRAAYTIFGSKEYKYMMFGSQRDNKEDNPLVNGRPPGFLKAEKRIRHGFRLYDPFIGVLRTLSQSTSGSDLLRWRARDAAIRGAAHSHCTVSRKTAAHSAGPPPGRLFCVRARSDSGHKGRHGLGSHFEPSGSRLNWLLRT